MDEFWMNPRKPMGAQWQGNAGFLGEREQTRETLPATPPGTTDEFINGQWVPRGDPLRRENMMIPPPMRNRYPAELGPDGQMRLKQEEVPQTRRPAEPTEKFPWGQSIADSFMGGLRKIDESPFWREGGSPSESLQQLKNALTGPRDPEVGRQFNQGPAMLPSFPVY